MKFLENKIPPPLVALVFAILMWVISGEGSSSTSPLMIALIFGLVILGIVFTLSGAVAFKKAQTTVNPLKPESSTSLVTSGVYQFTRNPMYVGFVFLLLAWAVFLGSLLSTVMIVFYILYIQLFQITPEERALTKLFGQEFTDYRARVRPWL